MKPLHFTLFIFLICLSCKTDGNEKQTSLPTLKAGMVAIEIEELPYFNPFNFDEIIDTLFHVFPKTEKDFRIGSYDKIVVHEEKIFIMDNTHTMSIYCLDFQGNFSFKIAEFGQGPGQYRELRDFTIDEDNNVIHILDFGGRSVRKFSSINGKYLGSTRLPNLEEYLAAFEYGNGNYFVAHANNCGNSQNCYNLTIHDENLTATSAFLSMNESLKSHDYRGERHFFNNGKKLYYKEVFNDTIYEIDQVNNLVKAAYFIDFGSESLPKEVKFSSNYSKLEKVIDYSIKNKKTWGIYSFHAAETSIFFNYSTPGLKSVYYSTETNQAVSFHKVHSRNPFLLSAPKSSHKDFYINITEAEFLYKTTRPFYQKDSLLIRDNYPDLYRLTKHLKRDDNHILTFYKIKL